MNAEIPSNLPGWVPTPSRLAGLLWSAKLAVAAGGFPDIGLFFNGGLGDDIMCSAVARELRRRGTRKIWQFTTFPEIFDHNPDVIAMPADFRLRRLCRLFGVPCLELEYPHPPPAHLIATLCAAAGIRGEIELRPGFVLTEAEKSAGRVTGRPQITIQTSSLSARFPMLNKQWPAERFQRVADGLAAEFDLVQLGAPSDFEVCGALDLRGKTKVRETASILSASRLFIGLVGGLMHLARAVECRSVIIYGGREHPSQSGYSANENLYWDGACAPCWQRNDCDFDRICMAEIRPDAVIAAVGRQAERYGTPLAIDRATL
jgi:hypothetical protein